MNFIPKSLKTDEFNFIMEKSTIDNGYNTQSSLNEELLLLKIQIIHVILNFCNYSSPYKLFSKSQNFLIIIIGISPKTYLDEVYSLSAQNSCDQKTNITTHLHKM